MRKQRLTERIRKANAQIHLVDKCLIVFMILLLLESSFNLFAGGTPTNETSSIDLIVRTSAAAIFGYFISANFIRHPKSRRKKAASVKNNKETAAVSAQSDSRDTGIIKNQIGFSAAGGETILSAGSAEPMAAETEEKPPNQIQIYIACGIGIFCLLVLVILRNIMRFHPGIQISPAAVATVTQFKDFVSACVGFLIGCPTNQSDDTE